jgi:hypothetical protein
MLAQYGPAPTRLVWWLLLGTSVAAAGTAGSVAQMVNARDLGVPRCRTLTARSAVVVRPG